MEQKTEGAHRRRDAGLDLVNWRLGDLAIGLEDASGDSIAKSPNRQTAKSMERLRLLARDRRAWLALLAVVAFAHYASYYRHGLNFRDEGGTVALVAQRMLAGERPFVDVSLGGYNVLWFWPVAGLFKIVGVSYVALRVYCFALATVAALLVFWIVERAGRRPWLAFLVALMAVLVPGMTFKNYMPLLALANGACLLGFTLAPPEWRARGWRLALGAVVLGFTWLIRVDLGMFSSALWLGALWLGAWQPCLPGRLRAAMLLGAPVGVAAIVLACHLPFHLDAQRRGYDAGFVRQYQLWPTMLAFELRKLTGANRPAAPAKPAATAAPVKSAKDREILRRKTWRDAFTAPTGKERALAALLYLPLLSLGPLALSSFGAWVLAVVRGRAENAARALAALLVIGSAFTVFPQYFFFRADVPHLSEFSPAFWAAVAAAPLLLGLRGWVARITIAVLALHAVLFLWRMWPDRWAGTLWARKGRSHLFEAENGVRVLLGKRERQTLEAMRDAIRAHSQPGDYLVAYPYHPAINLLANRPTYERDVYVDNATRNARWDEEAIARIEKHRPAVIVLSDWDVNGHEDSRFRVWAARTRTWIQENYEAQGVFPVSSDHFEVYTRR
jgi:hypothetical protein